MVWQPIHIDTSKLMGTIIAHLGTKCAKGNRGTQGNRNGAYATRVKPLSEAYKKKVSKGMLGNTNTKSKHLSAAEIARRPKTRGFYNSKGKGTKRGPRNAPK